MLLSEFDNRPMIRKDIVKMAKKHFNDVVVAPDTKYRERDKITEKLVKAGWKYLDSGLASMAFLHPRTMHVLKINFRPDRAYDAFVNLIHEQPNIHFPKIHDVTYILKGQYNFKAYLMEYLEGTRDSSWSLTTALLGVAIHAHQFKTLDDFKEKYYTYYETISEYSYPEELFLAAQCIGNFARTHVSLIGRIDLHPGNIMKRSDGTVVITDPYFNDEDAEF